MRSVCAGPLILIASLLFSGSAAGTVSRIEAETMFNHSEINCGADLLSVVSCPSASGFQAVEGVDCDGEYIDLHLTVSGPGTFCFSDSVSSAGAVGLYRTYRIDFLRDTIGRTILFSDTLRTIEGTGA
jgi:hypothetical protein